MNVLVAGIGGASLGTEIIKCLYLAKRYRVIGCDISPLAYGHYVTQCDATYLADEEHYVESVLDICRRESVACVIPGGEAPMALLNESRDLLNSQGILLAANSRQVIQVCSDKSRTFEVMRNKDIDVPLTRSGSCDEALDGMIYPCVVKPARNSGGSSFVFLARDHQEAEVYVRYLKANRRSAVVQEYIDAKNGEFTIGVLNLPDRSMVSTVVLRRSFQNKLSVLLKSDVGLLSTGYTQGYIGEFPDLAAQAKHIGEVLGSAGPLNIQGRVREGRLVPFEINPRFSASTYLRALAGVNEIDLYLSGVLRGERKPLSAVRPGYYLRSFAETVVTEEELKIR